MRKYWGEVILIIFLFYLFILQLYAIWPFTVDDMYISLRYAKHWASGLGLLWNAQEPPVEGYSNFLFVALGALALILKLNPVFVLKSMGIVGLLGTCIFIYLITRLWLSRRESLIPCIFLLLYKGQIIWAVSGLETSVYQALIAGTVYFIFKGLGYQNFPKSRARVREFYFIWAGLYIALAGLTRPEAPVFMLLFPLLIVWDYPSKNLKTIGRGLTCFFLPIVLLYLPYFFWRFNYYGLLFPNPIYCKGFAQGFFLLLDWRYFKFVWPFVLIALPACIWAEDRRHYFLWMPSVIYLILLANSDSVVAFFNRLFLTSFVLILPLAVKGLSILVLWIMHERDKYYFYSFYLAATCLAFLFIPWMTFPDYRYFTQNPLGGEQVRMKILNWLESNTKEHDVVVLGDSGLIPYLSNLNFIDSYCLNNKFMTQYPEEERYAQFCNNIMAQNPKVFILATLVEGGKTMTQPSDVCLQSLLSKNKKYKLTKTFSFSDRDSKYRYELFATN